MHRTPRLLTALIVAALAVFTFLRPAARHQSPPSFQDVNIDDLPAVSIPILGPARRIKGMGDPGRFAADPHISADLLEPRRLTLDLPDGKSLAIVARSFSVTGDGGLVEDVYVRRPLAPVRFKEAVADLRRTLGEMGIVPNHWMEKHMSVWPEDAPGVGEGVTYPYDFKTGTDVSPQVRLSIQVSGDPRGGWFYLMIFGAEVPARKSAQAVVRLTSLTDRNDAKPLPGEADDRPGEGLARRLPEVSVPLPGTPPQVGGMQLDEAEDHLSMSWPDALQPHRLTIHLPGAKTLSLEARAASLLYDEGVIHGLHVRWPMEPLPFGEAVADLRSTLKSLGVEPDETMTKQMAAWPPEAKGFGEVADPPDFRAGMRAFKGIDLEVRVLPDPKGGWFSLLTFQVTPKLKQAAQAERKAREEPPKPHDR